PEIELMLVERSRGMRFVGDSVACFREGDLVMVGPNVPHVWVNSEPPSPPRHDHAIAVIAQFRSDILDGALWTAPEFAHVAALLRRSAQGVQFTGPDAQGAAEHMRRMGKLVG